MSKLKTLMVATLCGLLVAQWSLADRKSDKEREERAQKAKERREREALLEPLRPLLDSPVDSSRYTLDPTKEVPQIVRDYVTASAAERVRRIKDAKKAIERRVELVAKAEVGAREALAKTVEELKELQANNPRFLAPLLRQEPAVGMIGTVAELRIQQVVGPTEAIVDWTWYTLMPYEDSVRSVPRYSSHPCSLWIRGVDTTTAADGSIISPPQVFQVTGTKTYPTAIGGTRTLFVIEPIDVGQYLKK